MREFIQSFDGVTVDLDDPKTYNHLPDNVNQLDLQIFSEIGYAYCYMNMIHADVFSNSAGCAQKVRVDEFAKNYVNERKSHWTDLIWFKEQLFLIQDETENMC